MKFTMAIVALALAVSVMPTPASAQAAPVEIALVVEQRNTPIPYTGATTLNYTLTAGCVVVLSSPVAAPAVMTTTGPSWLDVSADNLGFSAADVAACGDTDAPLTITKPGTLTITPGAAARALTPYTLNLTATMEDVTGGTLITRSDTGVYDFTVDYHAAHTVTPSITFPYTLTTPKLHFNVTANSTANFRTMIMFNDVSVTSGVVDGLAPVFIDNPPGEVTFPVTFTPPDGSWTNATISFVNFSHYCKPSGACGNANLTQTFHWKILNGSSSGGDDDGKKTPGVPGDLLAVALVGLVLILRRRNA